MSRRKENVKTLEDFVEKYISDESYCDFSDSDDPDYVPSKSDLETSNSKKRNYVSKVIKVTKVTKLRNVKKVREVIK